MKGNYPTPIYILMTLLGIAILIANSLLGLPIAASAVGAGLLAYGINRLIGAWRVSHDPEYAKKLETANRDERLSFIADKSRSVTLIIAILTLSVLGIILLSVGQKPYGLACFYITCGISFLYFVVYQVLSRMY